MIYLLAYLLIGLAIEFGGTGPLKQIWTYFHESPDYEMIPTPVLRVMVSLAILAVCILWPVFMINRVAKRINK